MYAISLHQHHFIIVVIRESAYIMHMLLIVHIADKEAHVRSDDYGRDLSSVQTLLTKQVRLFIIALVY